VKALTIHPPYPALILLPESNPHHKRVENRPWSTDYRGPLIIHSGKSRNWIGSYDPIVEKRLVHNFGAAVAVCNLVDCLGISPGPDGSLFHDPTAYDRYPWLRTHRHISGPFCFILANLVPFPEPVPYGGKQGFFDIPDWDIESHLGRKPIDLLREALGA
jgi:hypothetical protein